MIPQDEPFFFESGGRRLFAVWQPAVEGARTAALYCHPFGEEKKSAHRAFVETARFLAAEGVASLRFDMTGCGDSEGEFGQARLPLWIEDIAAAWTELALRAPAARRILIGLRLGAALAATACARLIDVHALLLWQPMLQGKREFDSELRRLLVQQMVLNGKASVTHRDLLARLQRGEGEVELDGYPVSPALYRDIGELDLTRLRPAPPTRWAVVQFARPQRDLEAFAASAEIPAAVVELPPIWARTEFVPSPETGERLAREGVLRFGIADGQFRRGGTTDG